MSAKDVVEHVTTVGKRMVCIRCGGHQEVIPAEGFPMTDKALAAYRLLCEDFQERHASCRRGHSERLARILGQSPSEWAAGHDTGSSSLTIFRVATGLCVKVTSFFGSPPLDSADFGRCYRLIALFPWMRAHLPRVAEQFPEWGLLVLHWHHMERLYEDECKGCENPRLYDFMQKVSDRQKDRRPLPECFDVDEPKRYAFYPKDGERCVTWVFYLYVGQAPGKGYGTSVVLPGGRIVPCRGKSLPRRDTREQAEADLAALAQRMGKRWIRWPGRFHQPIECKP